jgi:hypothetical protein
VTTRKWALKSFPLETEEPFERIILKSPEVSTPNTMLPLFSKLLAHLNRNFEEYAFTLQNSKSMRNKVENIQYLHYEQNVLGHQFQGLF